MRCIHRPQFGRGTFLLRGIFLSLNFAFVDSRFKFSAESCIRLALFRSAFLRFVRSMQHFVT